MNIQYTIWLNSDNNTVQRIINRLNEKGIVHHLSYTIKNHKPSILLSDKDLAMKITSYLRTRNH